MSQHKINPSKIKKEVRIPKKITYNYLHNSGLYYLERFASSTENFKSVMMRKIVKSCRHHEDQDLQKCALILDEVIKAFVGSGLLNDDVYAKGLTQSLRRRGFSKRYVLSKLQSKGIKHELAEKTIILTDEDAGTSEPELEAAIHFTRRKKIGIYSNLSDPDFKKQLGMMARAGFSYDISLKALRHKEEI